MSTSPTNQAAHRRRTHRLALAVLALLLVLAGCADGDDDSDAGGEDSSDESPAFDTETAEEDDGAEMEVAEEEDATDAAGEDALAQATALTPADLGRDIIFRAEIAVEVADVAAAGREATQRIEALGGVVFGQATVIEPSPRTVLTFKVAPADFDDALDQLGGVGELVDQSITADDVTDRVVDLESRVLTAETSVARLREFLAGAQTVQDVADLERELVARELELESLRGQLRTLRDQVALATITLTITEIEPESADARLDVISGLGDSRDDACPGTAELETTRDGTIVWCVEIENVGEATLTDIGLVSNTLGLRSRDFTVIDGDLAEMAPGAITRVEIELDVDDGRVRRRAAGSGLGIDVVVSAVTTDAPERTITVEREVIVVADDDAPLPGFADGFGRGVEVLAFVGSLLLLVIGALLPFAPVAAVVLAVRRFVRRRNEPAPTIEE
ncbi:MAG: DUF4349 domain-containing protein [Actinomycetota bacterium]